MDVEGHPGLRSFSLPTLWTPGVVGSIRLIRHFGRPPIDPAVESAALDLRGVPGLQGLHLNGEELGPPPAGVFDWTIPLTTPLSPRNTLSLDVDLAQATVVDTPDGWGSIALLIVSASGSTE